MSGLAPEGLNEWGSCRSGPRSPERTSHRPPFSTLFSLRVHHLRQHLAGQGRWNVFLNYRLPWASQQHKHQPGFLAPGGPSDGKRGPARLGDDEQPRPSPTTATPCAPAAQLRAHSGHIHEQGRVLFPARKYDFPRGRKNKKLGGWGLARGSIPQLDSFLVSEPVW